MLRGFMQNHVGPKNRFNKTRKTWAGQSSIGGWPLVSHQFSAFRVSAFWGRGIVQREWLWCSNFHLCTCYNFCWPCLVRQGYCVENVIETIQIHMSWQVFFFGLKFCTNVKKYMKREYLIFFKNKIIKFAKNWKSCCNISLSVLIW